MSFPGAVYNEEPSQLPLEAQPVTTGQGIKATAEGALIGGVGTSLIVKGLGALDGGGTIPHAQAEQQFKDNKYDPKELPAPDANGNVSVGAVNEIANQQKIIQKDRFLAGQAHLGAVTSGVAGFVGGMADPTVIGTGLIGGPLLSAAKAGLGVAEGAGLAARLTTGAVEGAVGTGAYMKATQQYGTAQGDRDITSGDIFKSSIWGGLVGAGLGGALGARAKPADTEFHLSMIEGAEGSAIYAKAHGIPVNEVTSANVNPEKRAYGLYQVTPETAKSLGFSGDPAMLKDAAYNKTVATANMERLQKKFPNDPEAIAVAWNAGPGAARKFIQSGRNRAILPKETQDYLARIEKNYGGNIEAQPPQTAEAEAGPPPVRVYHGTAADFDEYDADRAGESTHAVDAKSGVTFFTSDPEVAGGYARFAAYKPPATSAETEAKISAYQAQKVEGSEDIKYGQNIRPVNLSLKNPTTVDWGGEMYSQTRFAKAIAEAKAAGHDGVIFKNVNDSVHGSEKLSDVYASFQPNEAAKPSFGTHGIPNDTDVAAAKAAVAHMAVDSEVNVEPVIRESLKEKAGGKADPAELAKAMPVRDSAFTAPHKDSLAALNARAAQSKSEPEPVEGQPHPAVAQLQALAKQDIEDAKKLHFANTGIPPEAEGSFKDQIAAAHEELDREDGPPELDKAVDAGVRCAVQQGAA